MRTHGLVQSSNLLGLIRATTPIETDASLFLPHARALAPVEYPLQAGSLYRIPYLWEDDAEMYRAEPDWRTAALARGAGGLAVFCFHPIHVFLNSADMDAYRSLDLRTVTLADAAAVRRSCGTGGAGDAFGELLDSLADSGARGATISELAHAAHVVAT
jgi:hypothetical protein